MLNNGIINIHGKGYMTVARRVELAHDEKVLESVETEVLNHDPVVIIARVTIKGKVFTGISSVNLKSTKMIEKQNPYEVAETSAVGRALGFAGYGLIESIASADEMVRATSTRVADMDDTTAKAQASETTKQEGFNKIKTNEAKITCEICGAPATERKGKTKAGKPYHGIFCSTENRSHTRWLWN